MTPEDVKDLTEAITANKRKLGLVWDITVGEVLDSTDPNEFLVRLDGDTAGVPVVATSMGSAAGDRIFVISTPNGMNYELGPAKLARWGTGSGTPDASGYLGHFYDYDLGYTPTVVMVQPVSPITGAQIFAQTIVDSLSSASFRVRCLANVGTAVTVAVTYTWLALP